MMPTLRKVLRELNPDFPPFAAHTTEEIIAEGTSSTRYAAFLLGSLAALALALASIGLYGVLSYGVAQQQNEIWLRMALGSSRTKMLARVVSQGLGPALAGLALGILAAFGPARLLVSLLRGVQPLDLSTFLTVPLA